MTLRETPTPPDPRDLNSGHLQQRQPFRENDQIFNNESVSRARQAAAGHQVHPTNVSDITMTTRTYGTNEHNQNPIKNVPRLKNQPSNRKAQPLIKIVELASPVVTTGYSR